MANRIMFLDIEAGSEPLERAVMELHADAVPRTEENLRALCTAKKGFRSKGSTYRRLHEPPPGQRQVPLRLQVRTLEPPARAHGPGNPVQGERWRDPQRLAVLPHQGQGQLARQDGHGVRRQRQRDQEGRELRLAHIQEDLHQPLRPALRWTPLENSEYPATLGNFAKLPV
ncbi:hypothetical protein HPB48_002229 [Haemaphysalis longicornis]|uniref:PPIase cyclophilin-type domain-containing protein n=1 Tax=Haemaphysalis longicornis TaxID=44386 RepID=A0A9J6FH46_HAELO|nr:hypothetical protein HPB48_002229 [Haemaphysalis longicornis]